MSTMVGSAIYDYFVEGKPESTMGNIVVELGKTIVHSFEIVVPYTLSY